MSLRHRGRRLARRHAVAAAGLALALTGCQSCHDQKPYTPYRLGDGVASNAPAGAADAGARVAIDGGAPTDSTFTPVAGRAPEGNGASWSLGGAQIAAPAGRTFGVGLEVDVDRDGKPDFLGWAKSSDGFRGELIFAPGSAPADARTVFALPGDLAPAGCTAKIAMSLVGPRSVALDVRPTCPAVSRDRAVRYVAIVRWPDAADGRPGAPELGLELKIPLLAPLDVVVTTSDKDGDGRPDVIATFTTTALPKALGSATASAPLVFFDRAAGLSRDPAEPEATFKAAMTALIAEGRKPRVAAKVAPTGLALRRLAASLCEEGGGAAQVSTSGGPVRCGDVHVDGDVALADLEAAVNLGEPVAAAAALARVDALGPSGPRKKDVDKLIAKMLPNVIVPAPHLLAATPAAMKPAGYAPIAFLANGDLLVRTEAGVVRAESTALAETPDPPRAWPVDLGVPSLDPMAKLVRVERRCDEPTLIAHVEVKAGDGAKDVEVALPIATPPKCAAAASLPVFLLGATPGGSLVGVGADVVELVLSSSPEAREPESLRANALTEEQLGAARSPDGAALAIPTSRGVLVAVIEGGAHHTKASLWTSADLERPSFCVPANGGKRIACIAGSKVLVVDR